MDKKNDILQMLHDREEEFRLPLHEDAWDRLEASLPQQRPVVSHHFPAVWIAVAAVALLCLLLSVPLITTVNIPVAVLPPAPESLTNNTTTTQTQFVAQNKITPVKKKSSLSITKQKKGISSPTVNYQESSIFNTNTDTLINLPDAPVAVITNKVTPVKHHDNGPEAENKQTSFTSSHVLDKEVRILKKTNNWAFGLMAGCNNLSSNLGTIYESYPVTDPGWHDPDDPLNPDDPDKRPQVTGVSPDLPSLRKAQNGPDDTSRAPTYYYYRHRLPVTVSLSLRRHLFSNFSLESGLSYTYLYSDLFEDSNTIGEQSLHYIGIPLKLNWQFMKRGPVSMYLSGGAMLEYCISAKERRRDSPSHTLGIYPWQASLSAGAGAQFDLVKPLSLFVEPGIGYYFKTINYLRRTEVETIRTIHPLTFNLQIGIRLSY